MYIDGHSNDFVDYQRYGVTAPAQEGRTPYSEGVAPHKGDSAAISSEALVRCQIAQQNRRAIQYSLDALKF